MTDAARIDVTWRSDLHGSGLNRSVGDRAVYAIGDVHGCYDLTLALVSAFTADIVKLPPAIRPVIVFMGDYIDRGPRSADVLSMLVWMNRHAPCDVLCLKGNHEDMLVAFLDNPREALPWLDHGGLETLLSYGVPVDPDRSVKDQCEALRDGLLDRMPHSHFALLRDLPLHMTCGDYVFVHAGLRPNIPLDQQEDRDCLWIRDAFLDAPEPFEKIVVHGHTWRSPMPEITRARIGIDTGAYETGVLTGVRLTSSSVDIVQASRKVDEGDAG